MQMHWHYIARRFMGEEYAWPQAGQPDDENASKPMQKSAMMGQPRAFCAVSEAQTSPISFGGTCAMPFALFKSVGVRIPGQAERGDAFCCC